MSQIVNCKRSFRDNKKIKYSKAEQMKGQKMHSLSGMPFNRQLVLGEGLKNPACAALLQRESELHQSLFL